MIYLVDGVPGGGKSFFATRWIVEALGKGLPVATNVPLADDWAWQVAGINPIRRHRAGARRRRARELERLVFVSQNLDELFRIRVPGKGEGRWRLVIDEAHRELNSRSWNGTDRQNRIGWFSAHRHYGADVAILSQNIEMIDKQIRHLVEYRVRVRNIAKMRRLGVSITFGIPYFVAVHELHGAPNKEIARRDFYALNRRIRGIYSTHGMAQIDDPGADAILLPLPAATDDDAHAQSRGAASAAAASDSEPATEPEADELPTASLAPW